MYLPRYVEAFCICQLGLSAMVVYGISCGIVENMKLSKLDLKNKNEMVFPFVVVLVFKFIHTCRCFFYIVKEIGRGKYKRK